jgi:hypothetical protein
MRPESTVEIDLPIVTLSIVSTRIRFPTQDPSGFNSLKKSRSAEAIHIWLVLTRELTSHRQVRRGRNRKGRLGNSDLRVLEALLHKKPLPVNTLGPIVNLTPGSISVAVGLWVRADPASLAAGSVAPQLEHRSMGATIRDRPSRSATPGGP